MAVCLLTCTSCSETVKIPEIVAAVDNNAAVNINHTDYQCHVNYINNTTSSVEFQFPDNIKGLTYRKTENNQAISLGTLLCKSDNFRFTDNCVAVQIIHALDNVKQDNMKFLSEKDGIYTFAGKNDPSFKCCTDEKGNIRSLVNSQLSVKFS